MMSELGELPLLPTKRQRLAPDWTSCIICQSHLNDRFTQPTDRGVSCLVNTTQLRKDIVYSRLLPELENLFAKEVKWHASCYAKYTHKSNTSTSNTPSPTNTPMSSPLHTTSTCRTGLSTRLSTNHAAKFNVELCIIYSSRLNRNRGQDVCKKQLSREWITFSSDSRPLTSWENECDITVRVVRPM